MVFIFIVYICFTIVFATLLIFLQICISRKHIKQHQCNTGNGQFCEADEFIVLCGENAFVGLNDQEKKSLVNSCEFMCNMYTSNWNKCDYIPCFQMYNNISYKNCISK